MTESRQDLLKALEQSASDLELWAQSLGCTVDELCQRYITILREDGIAAQMILDKATQYISPPSGIQITRDDMIKAVEAIQARKIDAVVPAGGCCLPEVKTKLERDIKDALPNLRNDLLKTAKTGPQHRHGGRPKVLTDPGERRRIREEIRGRRNAGSTLTPIFEDLARKYDVSATKIKQVWNEKDPETPTP